MTASYRRSRKISAVCSKHSTRGTISSMLDGSRRILLSIYWICGSNTLARRPQLISKKFWRKKFSREQIFASWRLIARKSRKFLPRENFPLYGIYIYEKSQLRSLVWGSLTLAPINKLAFTISQNCQWMSWVQSAVQWEGWGVLTLMNLISGLLLKHWPLGLEVRMDKGCWIFINIRKYALSL